MWEHCNKALHESDTNEALRGITAINSHITDMYLEGPHPLMTPDEKILFHPPLDSLLRLRPTSKQAWVATVKASLSLCLIRHNSFYATRERLHVAVFRKTKVSDAGSHGINLEHSSHTISNRL